MGRLTGFFRKRPVILHYHIFKNAGTTLDGALQHSFPGHFREINSEHAQGTVGADEIVRLVRDEPALKAISSHNTRLPLPRCSGVTFLPFVSIRHPVDRLVSVYEFEKKQADSTAYPSRELAGKSTLEEFLDRIINVEPFSGCNWQVNYLACGGNLTRLPGEPDFTQACSVAGSLPFVGVVDRLDESMVVAEHLYGRKIKGLDLAYVSRNISRKRPDSLEARLAELKNNVSEGVYRRISEANAMDGRLYDHCVELLSRACGAVPHFAEKLLEFRQRCDSRKVEWEKCVREFEARKRVENGAAGTSPG